MEIVKSNMIDMVPFQLLYYGISNSIPTCAKITILGIPTGNLFTLYVDTVNGLKGFSINKAVNPKWIASTLQ